MIDVCEYVKRNFSGALVFGDIHGDIISFSRAYAYAVEHNLFFMSLGDLCDRGRHPYEVVSLMHQYMTNGNAGFVIGNHDYKFYRHAKGAIVVFSKDSQQTLDDVGPERMAKFLDMYVDIVDFADLSKFYHTFDDITMVHAAAHSAIWENPGVITKTPQNRFLVGETCNEIDDDGYPIRLYSWVDDIPAGKTVIIGHDKQKERIVMINGVGGSVVFADTGCGKGGFLTGAVVKPDANNRFVIDTYVDFK
jgi:hypothetical protein